MGRPQPADPPERADPGRPAGPGRRGRGHLLQLRLRDLGQDPGQGRGQRRGPGPGLRPPAGRHLPQPARPARSRSPPTRPGWSWSAAAPGSPCRPCRWPTTRPCRRMPESTGTVPSDVVRPGGGPGRGGRRPGRAAPGVHRGTGGDRGRDHLAAGHRPLPDGAQGAHLEPDQSPGLGHGAGAGQGAERHRPVDDRRRGGHPEPGQRRRAATASSASRATARRGSGRPPPACWTGSSPRSATS